MREVRIQIPKGGSREIVEIAMRSGARQATVYRAQTQPEGGEVDVISVETSTPTARRFVDSVLARGDLAARISSVTSRGLRAVVSSEETASLTRPLREPEADILQQLWQLSHITSTLVVRSLVAGSLLAYGLIENNTLLIVSALLFSPFLSQMLAMVFGFYRKDAPLVALGARSLLLSTLLFVAAGVIVALFDAKEMRYQEFGDLTPNAILSILIGLAAGFATVDDTGWRHFLGLATASQYARVPSWLGYSIVHGVGDWAAARERIYGFVLDTVLILLASLLAYRLLGMKRRNLHGG